MARKKKRRKQRSRRPASPPAAVAPADQASPPSSADTASTATPAAEAPTAEAGAPEISESRAPEIVAAEPTTPVSEPAAPAIPQRERPSGAPVSVAAARKDDLPVEDLDADLDGDGDGDLASLVAAVAGMDDEPAVAAPPKKARSQPTPSSKTVEVHDIHDLDEDDGAPASLGRLIAQVGRGAPARAPVERDDEDVPVIDLDADDAAPPKRVGATATAARPAPDMSRLAQAAAAGMLDETDLPAISLDLGDVSTPEARARLLAEALAHAEHKEARYRVPTADTQRVARWKALAASVVLLLAGVVAVAPPGWVRPEPPAQLTPGSRARGLRLALILQAQQVEAYRVRTNALPETLDQLPATLPGIRYARSGRSYQLVVFDPAGVPIVYDAADPSPAFRTLDGALSDAGDAP